MLTFIKWRLHLCFLCFELRDKRRHHRSLTKICNRVLILRFLVFWYRDCWSLGQKPWRSSQWLFFLSIEFFSSQVGQNYPIDRQLLVFFALDVFITEKRWRFRVMLTLTLNLGLLTWFQSKIFFLIDSFLLEIESGFIPSVLTFAFVWFTIYRFPAMLDHLRVRRLEWSHSQLVGIIPLISS